MARGKDRKLDFRLFRDIDSREVAHPAGTEIMGPGKAGAHMYVVKSGIAAVRVNEVLLEQVTDGDIFGEMSIIDPKPASASVFAITDVVLFAIDEEQFIDLVSKAPVFALRVMRILARRLRAMNMRLIEADQTS